jgi:hypothetical protein
MVTFVGPHLEEIRASVSDDGREKERDRGSNRLQDSSFQHECPGGGANLPLDLLSGQLFTLLEGGSNPLDLSPAQGSLNESLGSDLQPTQERGGLFFPAEAAADHHRYASGLVVVVLRVPPSPGFEIVAPLREGTCKASHDVSLSPQPRSIGIVKIEIATEKPAVLNLARRIVGRNDGRRAQGNPEGMAGYGVASLVIGDHGELHWLVRLDSRQVSLPERGAVLKR